MIQVILACSLSTKHTQSTTYLGFYSSAPVYCFLPLESYSSFNVGSIKALKVSEIPFQWFQQHLFPGNAHSIHIIYITHLSGKSSAPVFYVYPPHHRQMKSQKVLMQLVLFLKIQEDKSKYMQKMFFIPLRKYNHSWFRHVEVDFLIRALAVTQYYPIKI